MENEIRIADFQKLEYRPKQTVNQKKHSVWKDIWKELCANKIAFLFLILLGIIAVASLLAPLSPYDPNAIDSAAKFLPFSSEHWFGTDDYGRDVFTRALHGGRISLAVGFASMLVTVFIGTLIGVVSGYLGGKVDAFLMRFTDIFLALPSMLLMIVLNTVLTPSIPTLIAVLSLFSWASVARVTRAETMTIKERDYVKASQNLGVSSMGIIGRHIIPNITGTIIVAASLAVANAILMESSLSFLGLGVQIPQASWGSMLQGAQSYMLSYPRLAIIPGVLILITVLAFNLIGDVLRTALEPKGAK